MENTLSNQPPGVIREDSDDELGTDDLPWTWIEDADDCRADTTRILNIDRTYEAVPKSIVGARFGTFECFIGDTVLVKAEGSHEAWVAIICDFCLDEDGDMSANLMWFSTQNEIRHKTRKRTDFLQNELYLTPSWDVNPLATINGKARVMSFESFMSRFPNGKISRQSHDYGKIFVCRRGCNTRTATYTDEFVWEQLYANPVKDIAHLMKHIRNATSTKVQASSLQTSVAPTSNAAQPSTPRKENGGNYDLVNKRGASRKHLEFTPLNTRMIDMSSAVHSPFRLARSRLHVSSVPSSLPCRENEFNDVYTRLFEAIADGTGNCFYISGTPGTGKTATVREVIGHLEEAVRLDQLEDFAFVEINGMKVADPYQAYSLLWDALHGQRVGASQALDLLQREFNHPSPRRVPCVVLMDELDQLVTKNQGIMYNFFNWPSLSHSRLIVLAVANTMDLPERTLSNKISSRLGLTRITFPGYTHEQLMKIVQSRLDGVPGNIIDPDAIQFASRKVAAVSGDARRALDICRRAVELAESSFLTSQSTSHPTVTGTVSTQTHKVHKVTINTIKRAISEATSTPAQQHIKSLSFLSKAVLLAVFTTLRRTGLVETTVGDVVDEVMTRFGSMSPKDGYFGQDKKVESLAPPISSRLQSRNALVELATAGIIQVESLKTDRSCKLRLAVGQDDITMALREDEDVAAVGIDLR